MNNVVRVSVFIFIFLAVVGLINAKSNPLNSVFISQVAKQNGVQIVSNSQLSSLIQNNAVSGNGNPQAMASSIPSIIHRASGNFNPGGTVVLDIIGSPSMANSPYLITFSLYGDYPGLSFQGIGVVPVNPPYLASFFGFLGPNGQAQFVIHLPNDTGLIGLPLTSAVGIINQFTNQITLSNPVSFEVGRGITGVSCCVQGVLNGPGSQCIPNGVSVNYCRLNTRGAVQSCIPFDTTIDPPPANASNLVPSNISLGSSFMTNLTTSMNVSNITRRIYNATAYDCDDFADDMERWLQTHGYNATYTQFVKYLGNSSTVDYVHAVIDVHLPGGSIIWIEPQTGEVINLDFDGDGRVEANVNSPYVNGHHPTDDNAKIYVYDSAATAAANGAPRD